MNRPLVLALVTVGMLAASCSKGLHAGADAGRDSASQNCVLSPPAACGYVCRNGVWAATDEPCLTPDGAVSDTVDRDAIAKDGKFMDTGGTTATGGATGSGGVSAIGGRTVTGGTVSGGVTAVGGTIAMGGVTASGGKSAGGGTTSTGGVTAKGGTTTGGGATGTGGSRTTFDAGALGCVDLSGTWRVTGSCMGPRPGFDGSFWATMTQTGCNLTFTQTDEQSSTQWTSNGMIESTGRGYLKGKFGFTDSNMCDITVTAVGWDMICSSATQQCRLEARKATP